MPQLIPCPLDSLGFPWWIVANPQEVQHQVIQHHSKRNQNLHPNEPRVIYPSVYVSDVPVEWNEARLDNLQPSKHVKTSSGKIAGYVSCHYKYCILMHNDTHCQVTQVFHLDYRFVCFFGATHLKHPEAFNGSQIPAATVFGRSNLSSLGCHPQAASAARAESRHHHGFEVLAFHRSLLRRQLVGALKQCLQDVASKSQQMYI